MMNEPDARDQSNSGPIGMLQDFYAAELDYLAAGGPGKASFDDLAAYLDPEVVLHQATGLPYGGTWHGHRGMQEHFAAMNQAWESFNILEQEYLDHGDTIVVHSRIRARARTTGRDLDFPIVQIITFRNGRITEVRPFYWDTASVADACTQRQPDNVPR